MRFMRVDTEMVPATTVQVGGPRRAQAQTPDVVTVGMMLNASRSGDGYHRRLREDEGMGASMPAWRNSIALFDRGTRAPDASAVR